MTAEYKNRNIEIEDIENIDMSDYPDFCYAYVSKAYWEDTGEPLTGAELDELNDAPGYVYDFVINWMF